MLCTIRARALRLRNFSISSLRNLSTTAAPSPPSLASSPADAALVDAIRKLDIKIGKIVEIKVHPEASGLYIESVDIGALEGPRTIVSGLVQFCSMESLLNRKVVVLCNLKPRDFKGVTSHGMLLCSSNGEHSKVEPIIPAESSQIGEAVNVEGLPPSEPCEVGNKATKMFSKVADMLFVDEKGSATFKGKPFITASGGIITSSLLKGKIS